MTNTKTKIILSAIIFLSITGFCGAVNAAGASLYVLPATLTKTAGDTFSASAGFNASGSKVCAVEGTLVFNNLSCQSITVSGDADIVPQSSPTCLNPHFLIGIQNCTTSDKVLLAVSVKAGTAGAASISFTGVDIIGEGMSVGSASTNGNYTINAVLTPTPIPVQPKPAPTSKTTTPQNIEQPETQTVTQPEEQPIEQPAALPAAVGSASLISSMGGFVANHIFTTIIIIIVIALLLWWAIAKFFSKKKPDEKVDKQ
jgi:hypothetical protein